MRKNGIPYHPEKAQNSADTGIFCEYNHGVTQFAGFAPADEEVCSSPYYYNSFYKNDEKIIPSDFPELNHGYWETEKWAGAVFPLYPGTSVEEFNVNSRRFLLDSTDVFLNRILPEDKF